MRSLLLILSFLIGGFYLANAQVFPTFYMHKDLRIHTDTSVVELSIIDEEVKFKPHKNLIYHWYQNRQVYQNQGGVAGNVIDGKYRCFDGNGHLIVEGQFNKGLKSKTWKQWDVDGKLIEISKWCNGKPVGRWMVYSPSEKALISKPHKDITGKKSKNGKFLKLFKQKENFGEIEKTDSLESKELLEPNSETIIEKPASETDINKPINSNEEIIEPKETESNTPEIPEEKKETPEKRRRR